MNVKRRSGFLLGGAIVFLLLMGLFAGETVLAAEKKVAKVALGDAHSAAIDTEGGLWMWGENRSGELGNGERTNQQYPGIGTPVKVMDDAAQVSLGDDHSGAVKKDGSLWMWGNNSSGQLGDGTTTDRLRPVKIMDSGVSQVVLCGSRSAAIMEDGRLLVWGANTNNNLGLGGSSRYTKPQLLLENVVQADLGCSHGGAVKKDGSLWMWGHNNYGQLGLGNYQGAPKQVPDMTDIKQLSLGYMHSGVVKTDGSLWMWGHNWYQELGSGISEDQIDIPQKVMDDVAQISLGTWMSTVLKSDGKLLMIGKSDVFTFRSEKWEEVTTGVKAVELGGTHAAVIKPDGSLWTWGAGWCGQLGDGVANRNGYKQEIPVRISIGVPPNTNNSGNANNSNNSSSNNGTTSAGTGASKAVPGKSSTYTDQKITYKVTKSDAKNGTVALTKYDKKKTSVVIPATVTINGYTFKVTQISGKAFYKNKKLKKVTIGKNITSIGAKAFQGCTSLKSMQIKSTSLKKVGGKALSGIHKKATIKVPSKKLKAYKKLFKKKGQASTVKIKK